MLAWRVALACKWHFIGERQFLAGFKHDFGIRHLRRAAWELLDISTPYLCIKERRKIAKDNRTPALVRINSRYLKSFPEANSRRLNVEPGSHAIDRSRVWMIARCARDAHPTNRYHHMSSDSDAKALQIPRCMFHER